MQQVAGRMLVVNSSVIVCEDLRDILLDWGVADVTVVHSLDADWAGPFTTAFIEVSCDDSVMHRRIGKLIQEGTSLVFLDEPIPGLMPPTPTIHYLAQPFRAEDVIQVLVRLAAQVAR